MGVIGIWQDGLDETTVAGLLAAVGHQTILVPAGSALPEDIDVLVANARTILAMAGPIAARRGRDGADSLPLLAVLAATADDAAVQAVLAVADEVIRRPVGAAELSARLGRLLACRELTLARERGFSALRPNTLPGGGGCLIDVTGQESQERQLALALKMASLGQLAAGIAHEINTPVQYVGGNLEFLGNTFGQLLELLDKLAASALTGQGELSLAEELTLLLGDEELRFVLEETPAAIRESKEGLDRVSTIVHPLERFAHPGKETALPVNVAEAVADTLAVTSSAWKFAADVTVEIDATLPPVLFVPGDCNLMLLNIVVNAAQAIEEKFAPTGSKGHITIRAAQNGPFVELVIADDGPGIPAVIRPRIFDPFFTTKPVGKGTGLGLAIVQAIVAQHKAGLEVLSTPGEGTRFVLRLPVAAQAKIGH